MTWDFFNQSILRYEKNPWRTVCTPASESKTSSLIFIKYSRIMGTSSEITVYSLTAIKHKERLNFLPLLVSASKTHLGSMEKSPMMQLIMNIKDKKT